MKSQSGFTLIEMVAVIIILAIMAATAMPRFVNMAGDARLSSLQGMMAALNSAKTLVKAKWVAQNSAAVAQVDFGGGTYISVVSAAGVNGNATAIGFPYAGTSGMWLALDNPTGFGSSITVASGLLLWPTGVTTSANCVVGYDASGVVTMWVSAPAANAALSTSCL